MEFETSEIRLGFRYRFWYGGCGAAQDEEEEDCLVLLQSVSEAEGSPWSGALQ